MPFPHIALDLEGILERLLESQERSFLAYLSQEPSELLENQEMAKDGTGNGKRRPVWHEYDGFDHFTRIEYNPKTGGEKYYRWDWKTTEEEEYDGFEFFTRTEYDPKTRSQRHYRGSFQNSEESHEAREYSKEANRAWCPSSQATEGAHARIDSIYETKEAQEGRPQNNRSSKEITLLSELEEQKDKIALAAQSVYDGWLPTDDESGGICEEIQSEIWSILSHIDNIDLREWGHEGDEHAAVIAKRGDEQYIIDIPYWKYELHFGLYNWQKITNVRFTPDDVEILPI